MTCVSPSQPHSGLSSRSASPSFTVIRTRICCSDVWLLHPQGFLTSSLRLLSGSRLQREGSAPALVCRQPETAEGRKPLQPLDNLGAVSTKVATPAVPLVLEFGADSVACWSISCPRVQHRSPRLVKGVGVWLGLGSASRDSETFRSRSRGAV